MSMKKTYFLCPSSDFIPPPTIGPLCLGSIICSTSEPQSPLNRGSVVAVADAIPPVVDTDWKKTVSTETGLGAGVYAQFLQLVTGGLRIGPGVDVEHSYKTTNMFAFDTLTTLAFEPTQEYVEEAVKAMGVQAWLREHRRRLPLELFIVTGMKIVKGAKIQYSTSQSTTASANLGIDVPAVGMTFGPKGHWTSTNDDATEFNRECEFVFAFSVKRLRFWWSRRPNLQVYNKGAFMALPRATDDDQCVSVEDVDGANIKNAEVVPDMISIGSVYCVSP